MSCLASVARARSLFCVTTSTSIRSRSSCCFRAQAVSGRASPRRAIKTSAGTAHSSASAANGASGNPINVTGQPRSCIQHANFRLFSSNPPKLPDKHSTASGRRAGWSWLPRGGGWGR